MSTHRFSRRVAKVAIPVAAAALTMAAVAPAHATTAVAADETIPTFDFADCPTLPEGYTAQGSVCYNAVVVGGTFALGKFKQTITSPIRMTFASAWNPTTLENKAIFGTLKADKMLVQPGIFGDPIVSAVYAKPEYAGVFDTPPSADFRIKLGLKIRLTNPFLGGSCLIGTNSNPITLNLTTGTTAPPAPNTPITGETAKIVATTPVVTRSATHVDNAFSAPGATGCALNIGLVNHIVNSQAGVPSAAGSNTMVFKEYIGQKKYTALP